MSPRARVFIDFWNFQISLIRCSAVNGNFPGPILLPQDSRQVNVGAHSDLIGHGDKDTRADG